MSDYRTIDRTNRLRQEAEAKPWAIRLNWLSDIAIMITCMLTAYALSMQWIGLLFLAIVKQVEFVYILWKFPSDAAGKKSKLAYVFVTMLAALFLAMIPKFISVDMALFGIIGVAAITFFVALDSLWDIINNRSVGKNAQTFSACVLAALFLTYSLTKGFSAGPLVAAFVTLGFVVLKAMVEGKQIFAPAPESNDRSRAPAMPIASATSSVYTGQARIVRDAREQKFSASTNTVSASTSTTDSFPQFSEWRNFLIKSDGTTNTNGYLYPKIRGFLDEKYPDQTRVSFRHTYFGQDVNQTKDEIMEYIVSQVKANRPDNLRVYLKDLRMPDAELNKIFPAIGFQLPSGATASDTASNSSSFTA